MGAAPQRRYRAALPTEPAWPVHKRAQERSSERTLRRKAAGRRRRFAMLVVVPVVLMLGSVYLHTVAAGLDARAVDLGVQLGRARDEGERLQVRVTELSGSARIRELAGKLGMRQPDSGALKVYGSGSKRKAEDGIQDGTQQEGGEQR
jgi:cell division protein FtsL